MAEPSNRSPIKDKPLRHAGQSLEQEFRDLVSDKIEPYVLLCFVYVALAGIEWWRYYSNDKPHPLIYSAVAVAGVGVAAWQIYSTRERRRNLKQGIDGERAVGQYLERMRSKGYEVFHDIMAPSFNIDHVLIGPAGVFTIETKTWSKPAKGDARIMFDGEQLSRGGMTPDRNPIVQARAEAAWLRNLLAESTGRRFDVHPVVLFPGWFVEQAPGSFKTIWVLEPKALPRFIEHEPQRMETADAKLAAFHLSRFIRSAEKERMQ